MGLRAIIESIFGGDEELSKNDLNKATYHNSFSKYLPYLAYDPENEVYTNADNTTGIIFECSPLLFASEKTAQTLEGLFRLPLPERSNIQFLLFADPDLDAFTQGYAATRSDQDPIIKESTQAVLEFIHQGVGGLNALQKIPIRNFRLFVSIKVPAQKATEPQVNMPEIKSYALEILKGCQFIPRTVKPEELLAFLRQLFNDDLKSQYYNTGMELRRQIILADSNIDVHNDRLQIGSKHFRCLTPKVFPASVSLLNTNILTGGIMGMGDDINQVTTPFLYSVSVIFQGLKAQLHTKCNLILQQQGSVGSFAPSLERKKSEYLWATGALEAGTTFLKIMPIVWVFGSDKESTEAISRVKRMWESTGFIMQEDRGILPVLFIASLPFGLYDVDKNIEMLDRDFIVPTDVIPHVLPIQSDFTGGGQPVMLFIGRKGQVIPIDIYDRHANNHNVFIAAASGSGKSFLVNNMAYNYYSTNSAIRIIDVGFSYRKMARMLNGAFIDFHDKADISLNPFTTVQNMAQELSTVSATVLQMAYSSTDYVPKDTAETGMTLIKLAVQWAYMMEGTGANMDTVHEYLKGFPKYVKEEVTDMSLFKEKAHELAFNLQGFTSCGQFGKWFSKPANLDISNDRFVVLELENLKPCKELFKVVTLQVINAVTTDLYLSDRSSRRFIIFDEAWQFLQDGLALKTVIEEGYRRARKYGGSFTTITQSILDLKAFGSVGDVINANSAFKFFMESNDFNKAKEEKLISYDDFTVRLLNSVKSNRPKYSEIFMDSPFGKGIARLVVDPFSYFIYTSDAKEVAEIEGMVRAGVSYVDAIKKMVSKYRS